MLNGPKIFQRRKKTCYTQTLRTNWVYADTFRIAEKLLNHPHVLIHKATGWMLREVGKRGGLDEMKAFLNRYAPTMPRTTLRYALEKLPDPERQYYLRL